MRDGEVGLGLGRLPQGTHGALEIAFGGQVEPMIAEPGGGVRRVCGPEQARPCLELFQRRALDRRLRWQDEYLGKNRLKKGPLPTSAAASSRN